MRIPLLGGAYQAKSIIANAQRCLNLYPEPNPQDAAAPVTHYPRPGLTKLASPPTAGVARCIYRASNGNLYYVVGYSLYSVSSQWVMTLVGTLQQSPNTLVSMADNGVDIMVVDGSANGYVVNLATNAFTTINNAAFYGANFVQYVDTYFVLNRPGYPTMYISMSNSTDFDSLDFASKTGNPDPIVGLQITRREIWLIGAVATEVWYNTGASDFTFGPISGVYVEHGCCAQYSIAKQDLSIYWLSQDAQGHLMVLEGNSYRANRISTFAIENEIQGYEAFADAIGCTYQFEGHTFYQLTFPTADKTWVYDASSGLWHEESWTDNDGIQHRHRANCAGFAFDTNLMGDWETGDLYKIDPTAFTDNGQNIVYLRSFPHVENDGKRLIHSQFIADMEVGTAEGTSLTNPPEVSLRWSDTRGASWGNPIQAPLGSAGQYLTSIQFRRLGMARDRVYELSWSAPYKTALNGAWIDLSSAAT